MKFENSLPLMVIVLSGIIITGILIGGSVEEGSTNTSENIENNVDIVQNK